jgi:hypothetical protein
VLPFGVALGSGTEWATHRAASNENVVVIPLIETIAGVDNLEKRSAMGSGAQTSGLWTGTSPC